MPEKSKEEILSPQARSTIKTVFLTLFLDLVGFSIIFPLFPALIQYYLEADPGNFCLRLILDAVHHLQGFAGQAKTATPVVLFGGILGALYSFLQFLMAPFWGSLSDRWGRKRILVISVSGMAICYLIWIFSGSFTLLILSRFIGGVMAGNISTANAAIGDVTTEATRSRGMAFVGIAFGTGFIFGPALGGLTALIRLDQIFPNLIPYGLNPFSAPALLAFVLSIVNLISIIVNFKETLPPEKRGQSERKRSANPFTLFKPHSHPGINLTKYANFFFLMAFSGMEFTLTFLAAEKLNYSARDNAGMFIYIGVLMALVQGGFVRRKAHSVGERKMALMGMISVIPGLMILSGVKSSATLYLGLTFLALGMAMIIPCLTALVSLYADSKTQGQSIGTYQSLGSLARVVGPFGASFMYWRLGSSLAYLMGAVIISLPIVLVSQLPKPKPL